MIAEEVIVEKCRKCDRDCYGCKYVKSGEVPNVNHIHQCITHPATLGEYIKWFNSGQMGKE